MSGGSAIARLLISVVVAAMMSPPAPAQEGDRYAGARRALVAELRSQSRGDAGTALQIDRQTLDVIGRVPRHEYVPASERGNAYENRPLGIGYGQTISQPYIVALMTTLAKPRSGQKILEIGTGSGYQAAVLAESGPQVFSIEIV